MSEDRTTDEEHPGTPSPGSPRSLGGVASVILGLGLALGCGALLLVARETSTTEERMAIGTTVIGWNPQRAAFEDLRFVEPLAAPELRRTRAGLAVVSAGARTERFDLVTHTFVYADDEEEVPIPAPPSDAYSVVDIGGGGYLAFSGAGGTELYRDGKWVEGPALSDASGTLATDDRLGCLGARASGGGIAFLCTCWPDGIGVSVSRDGKSAFVRRRVTLPQGGTAIGLAVPSDGDALVFVRDGGLLRAMAIDPATGALREVTTHAISEGCPDGIPLADGGVLFCPEMRAATRTSRPGMIRAVAAYSGCAGLIALGAMLVVRGRVRAGPFVAGCLLLIALFSLLVLYVSHMGVAHGRPLRRRGRPLSARLRRVRSSQRRALAWPLRWWLARAWAHDAALEAGAVAAFDKLAAQLRALAADPALIEWAERASREEAGHARRACALVGTYDGAVYEPVGPAVPVLDAHELDLASLAFESLVDGCLGEGVAAEIARVSAARATDPQARGFLASIVDEERSHAELAWAVVAFALDRDPGKVHPALADALERVARARSPRGVPREFPALTAHGRLNDETTREVFRYTRKEVVERARAMLA